MTKTPACAISGWTPSTASPGLCRCQSPVSCLSVCPRFSIRKQELEWSEHVKRLCGSVSEAGKPSSMADQLTDKQTEKLKEVFFTI